MGSLEKIFEGSYTYLNEQKEYSQENFEIWKKSDGHYPTYLYQSEILSRVSTGEFLKVGVEYVVNHHFEPMHVHITKHLGTEKTDEKYDVDQITKEVSYSFQLNNLPTQTYQKIILGKFQIATPALVTSFLMIQSKKIDPMHRTQYELLTTNNAWSYEGPFQEKNVYVELMNIEALQIEVGKKKLNATWYNLFEHDQTSKVSESGIPFYISKHLGIPYKAILSSNVVVQISKLKDLNQDKKILY